MGASLGRTYSVATTKYANDTKANCFAFGAGPNGSDSLCGDFAEGFQAVNGGPSFRVVLATLARAKQGRDAEMGQGVLDLLVIALSVNERHA